MRARAVPVVDQLDRDGRRLVLVQDRAVLLVGLAPAILDACTAWTSLDALTATLERLYGAPEGLDTRALVGSAVDDLAAQGLLVVEEP